MFKVEMNAGRLLEIRAVGLLSAQEVAGVRSGIGAALARAKGPLIFAIDFRAAEAFPPDVVPMVVGIMKYDNSQLERNAQLHSVGSSMAQQMEALVSGSNNPLVGCSTSPASCSAGWTKCSIPKNARVCGSSSTRRAAQSERRPQAALVRSSNSTMARFITL